MRVEEEIATSAFRKSTIEMDSLAAVAARMSLKRDHREACTMKVATDTFSSGEPNMVATTTSDTTAARRETYNRRAAHEASRSVLARFFADAPLPSSPLSQLTVDALASPRRELLSVDINSAPMSWPRAFSRCTSSNQTSLSHLHTHQNIFETSPTGTPRSASIDFRQQLQEHQQHRFLLKQATTGVHKQHQHLPEAEAEPQDEVSMLREQVALLLKNLDDEKKRRMLEQKLMQEVL